MKTKEELNAIKEKLNSLREELSDLSEEELKTVTGGKFPGFDIDPVPFKPDVEYKNNNEWSSDGPSDVGTYKFGI